MTADEIKESIYFLATINRDLYLDYDAAGYQPGAGCLNRDLLIEDALQRAKEDGVSEDAFLDEAGKIEERWWLALEDELNEAEATAWEFRNPLAAVGMRQSDFL